MGPSQRFNYTTNYGHLTKFKSPFLKLICLNNQNCGLQKKQKTEKQKCTKTKPKIDKHLCFKTMFAFADFE